MKNGKDRNVYDVMNDVNVDIETMDMSDEEKLSLIHISEPTRH